MKIKYIKTGADISECGRFRHSLWRVWDQSKPACCFIGLNPSTADGSEDDPTIRRCVRFAVDWGFGKLIMVNLWPYRATDPAVMQRAILEMDLDDLLQMCLAGSAKLYEALHEADLIVAAWGDDGAFMNRGQNVLDAYSRKLVINCLKMNKSGQPAHPLYLKADLKPSPIMK